MTTTITFVDDDIPVFTPTAGPIATSSYIDLELIDPNPKQPRTVFDRDKLEELASSIREYGVIQPIVVEITDDGYRYTLHAGERRCRAARLAGLETIPAYILPPGTDPKDLLIRATIENVQRTDMTPIEEARAYQQMKDEYGMSDADIGKSVGKSRSAVANTRRLLQLPADRQDQVDAGNLSERQALALLPFYQLSPDVQNAAKDWETMVKDAATMTSDEIREQYKRVVQRVTQRIPWPVRDDTDGNQPRSLKCIECTFCVAIDTKNYGCADIDCYTDKRDYALCQIMDQATRDTGIPSLFPMKQLPYRDISKFWDSDENQAIIKTIMGKKCPNLRLYYYEYDANHYIGPTKPATNIVYACYHPDNGTCQCVEQYHNVSKADERRAEKERKAGLHRLRDKTANALARELQTIPTKLLGLLGVGYFYGDKLHKFVEAISNDDQQEAARRLSTTMIGRWCGADWLEVEHAHQTLIDRLTPMGLADLVPNITDPAQRLAKLQAWIETTAPHARRDDLQAKRNDAISLMEELIDTDAFYQAETALEQLDTYIDEGRYYKPLNLEQS